MIEGLKPYPSYQPSGILWADQLPAHWEIRRAKWLFRQMDRPPRDTDDVVTCFRDGTVTLRRNRRTTGFTEALQELGYQGIRRGDLVIHGMDAFAGAVGVSDSDGKGTPVYSVCLPQSGVNAHYYAAAIREMARAGWIEALSKGIRERSTDFRFERFAVQPMPVPAIGEQAAIVRFLDYADRRIRRYIAAKQRLIRLLEEEKRAIIHRAVTRGVETNVRLISSGVDWLGDVPGHWRVQQLRRLATSWCDGPFGSGLRSSHYSEDGVRVVRLQNIGFAQFKGADSAFISEAHYRTLGDHSVVDGDLLIAGLGDPRHPAGRACVAPSALGAAMVKADCFRFRLDRSKIEPGFAALYLSATASEATAALSAGATRQRINLSTMATRPVAVPPLAEQISIVAEVGRRTASTDKAMTLAERPMKAVLELRTRLIADVVTGKLDVRGAAMQLAEEPFEADRDVADSLIEDAGGGVLRAVLDEVDA